MLRPKRVLLLLLCFFFRRHAPGGTPSKPTQGKREGEAASGTLNPQISKLGVFLGWDFRFRYASGSGRKRAHIHFMEGALTPERALPGDTLNPKP